MEAEDFLQMRSIVQGFSKELDDPGELDIFINNMKYSTFVQRVTRDESRQRSLLHKYQGDKLLETLNSVLMMPDCPGRNETISTTRAVRQVSTPPREATTVARTSQIPRLFHNVALESMLLVPLALTQLAPVDLAVEELVVDLLIGPTLKSTTAMIKVLPMKMFLGHLRITMTPASTFYRLRFLIETTLPITCSRMIIIVGQYWRSEKTQMLLIHSIALYV